MNMKKSGIYKITNKFNGRLYIGSTIDFMKRWAAHQSDLFHNRHPNQYMQNDYNACKKEYGEEPLTYEILEMVSKGELLVREQYYLDLFFDSKDRCYNICEKAGNTLGYKPSEQTKALWREQRKGKDMSKATKASVAARVGKPRSEETKEKIRAAHLGKKMSEITKNKLRKPKTVEHIQKLIDSKRDIADTTKEKLRQAKLGKKATDETKEKMSLARSGEKNPNFGKVMSEEQKQMISETKAINRYGDKTFVFMFDDKTTKVKATDLRKFMLENNFERSSFYRLLSGKLKAYKGWTIEVENGDC